MGRKFFGAVFVTATFIVFFATVAQAAGSYDFSCETPVTAVEQFDHEIQYRCLVKNTGDSYLELFYEVQPEQNPIDPRVAVGFHPQPSSIYLEVGESQPVAGFEVSPRVPAGQNELRYTRTFTINPAGESVGLVSKKSVTITTIVISEQLKDDARVSGNVIDAETGQPIGSANISFRYESFERRSLARDGRYTAELPALQYLMQIEAPDYELYVTRISPHGAVTKDVSLTRADKIGSYTPMEERRLDSGAWEGIWRAAVSDDGRYVGFGSGGARTGVGTEAYMYLFTTQGDEVLKMKTPEEVRGIDVSSDGSLVGVSLGDGRNSATGSAFEKVRVYKKSGELLWKKFTDEEVFYEIRFSHDGKYVAVGDRRGYLYLLDAADGREIWKKFTGGQVRAIRFYDDNSHLLVGSGDDRVYLFDISGNRKWRTYVHSWSYGFIAATPGNDFSAAGGHISYLHLLDRNGKDLWSYEADGGFRWAEIGPQASYVVGGTRSEIAMLDGKGAILWKGYDSVSGGATKDKKYIISGNQRGEFELRNTKGTILWAHRTNQIEPGKDVRLAYISDDASLIVGAIKTGEVYFFKGDISTAALRANVNEPAQNPPPSAVVPMPIASRPVETDGVPPKPPMESMPMIPGPAEMGNGSAKPPVSPEVAMPHERLGPGPFVGGDPRDIAEGVVRGINVLSREPEAIDMVVDGAEVRGWTAATKDAVRKHLVENDAKNDANDFGLRVAMLAIENHGIHAIAVHDVALSEDDTPQVSVDYTAQFKFLGLFAREVSARLSAYSDGSTDNEYDAPWYIRWFSTSEERTDLIDIATEVRSKLEALQGGG